MIPPDAYGDATTRVLLACLAEHCERGRVTVRSVAARAGLSVSTAHSALLMLRRLGSVTWADGTTGTLRPLVHPVELGS